MLGGGLAADDQGSAGLVNQNGVHFVHNGVVQLTLHYAVLVKNHVVPQVVEAKLVVGAVNHVGGVGAAALVPGKTGHDQAHLQAENAIDRPHPLAVTPGQVIVHGHDVYAPSGKRVQVRRQGGHQGLPLTGLHLGDAALVQHDPAQDLNVKGTHPGGTPGGLPGQGEGFGEQLVQGGTPGQPLLQRSGAGGELLRLQGGDLRLQGVYLLHQFPQAAHLAFVGIAEDLLQDAGHQFNLLSVGCGKKKEPRGSFLPVVSNRSRIYSITGQERQTRSTVVCLGTGGTYLFVPLPGKIKSTPAINPPLPRHSMFPLHPLREGYGSYLPSNGVRFRVRSPLPLPEPVRRRAPTGCRQ